MSLRANQIGRINIASIVRPGLAAPSIIPVRLKAQNAVGTPETPLSIVQKGKHYRIAVERPGLARPLVMPSEAGQPVDMPVPQASAEAEKELTAQPQAAAPAPTSNGMSGFRGWRRR